MKIKNVIFDIGNVIVRWDPYEVIQSIFPENDPKKFYREIRSVWIDLNLGKCTENEAILIYEKELNIESKKMKKFLFELKVSQTPIPGSIELLQKLNAAGVPLFSITDNIKEIIEHHKAHSNFLHYFNGVVVSADVGFLKPDLKIFKHLLEKYSLNPSESIFIDDSLINTEGALSAGMQAFQFTDAKSCEEKLMEFGLGRRVLDKEKL